jgi:excisionase family DNA binding protein
MRGRSPVPVHGAIMAIGSAALESDKRKQRHSCVAELEPLAVAPKQACRLLGVGNTRLYQLIAAGELESYRDGRSRRITMSSIRARIARLLAVSEAT